MARNTPCGMRRAKERTPSPSLRSDAKRRPATMAAAARPGTRTVPVALGHWLYMVSASAGMFGSMPAMTGAARSALRDAVSTETRAARPMTHTAIRAREETLAVWTTESYREKSATKACQPVG